MAARVVVAYDVMAQSRDVSEPRSIWRVGMERPAAESGAEEREA